MNGSGPQPPAAPGEKLVQIDISKIADSVCLGCKSVFFHQAFKIKQISQFMSPDGKEKVYHAPFWVCDVCGLELNVRPLVDK